DRSRRPVACPRALPRAAGGRDAVAGHDGAGDPDHSRRAGRRGVRVRDGADVAVAGPAGAGVEERRLLGLLHAEGLGLVRQALRRALTGDLGLVRLALLLELLGAL